MCVCVCVCVCHTPVGSRRRLLPLFHFFICSNMLQLGDQQTGEGGSPAGRPVALVLTSFGFLHACLLSRTLTCQTFDPVFGLTRGGRRDRLLQARVTAITIVTESWRGKAARANRSLCCVAGHACGLVTHLRTIPASSFSSASSSCDLDMFYWPESKRWTRQECVPRLVTCASSSFGSGFLSI